MQIGGAGTLKTVERNFNVDDCLKSVSTPKSAIGLISQLRWLLNSGGFHLSKVTSNCRLILFSVPETERSVYNAIDIICDLPVSKTLRLVWDTSADTFKIKVNIREKPRTRRGLLSIISQVHDILGLVQPIMLPMKRHLQLLNLESLSWDDPLPDRCRPSGMCSFRTRSCPLLQEVSLARCFKPPEFDP